MSTGIERPTGTLREMALGREGNVEKKRTVSIACVGGPPGGKIRAKEGGCPIEPEEADR